MKRENPIQIEIKKDGKHFAVLAENELVALTVYRKGAVTTEALLRGLIKFSGRKLFRLALAEALKAPEVEPTPVEPVTDEQTQLPKKSPKAGKSGKGSKTEVTQPEDADQSVQVEPIQAPEITAEATVTSENVNS